MNKNIRIAKELVRIARSIVAGENGEEDIDGVAYSTSLEKTINVTATFEVEYDDDGFIKRVGDLVSACDSDGNDVTDDIDEDSIDDLSSKLFRSML